jgi:hypothetical protein
MPIRGRDKKPHWPKAPLRGDFNVPIRSYWSEEEPLGETGGLRDVRVVDFAETARRALDEALAASRGVTSAEDRWELVGRAKEVLKEIEAGGPREEPDF